MSDDSSIPDLPGGISASQIREMAVSFTLADPGQDDCPLIYVNRAFERTTGYTAEAAVGRNCRFLQGPETAQEAVNALRAAIANEESVAVDLLNYRADGSIFNNHLIIAPLYDDAGGLMYYLGVQSERPPASVDEARIDEMDNKLKELQHRVKNHLSMILSVIRMEARQGDVAHMEETLSTRIRALSILYDHLAHSDSRDNDRVDAGAYISTVATALHQLDGRPNIRLNIDVAAVAMEVDEASRLGLIASEMITNALKHAFDDEIGGGEIRVELRQTSEGVRLSVEDDGKGIDPQAWPNEATMGGRIVTALVARAEGSLVARPLASGGTQVVVEI